MYSISDRPLRHFEVCIYLLREATEELIEKLREDEAHILWRENRPSVLDVLNPLGGLCVCVCEFCLL